MLVCKFPTRVIILDDDLEQIEALKSVFDDKFHLYEFYTDPRIVIDILDKYEYINTLEEFSNSSVEDNFLLYNFSGLYSNVEDGAPISVIMSDYRMTKFSGLDVLKGAKNKNIYRILYTGVADKEMGINALNNSEIDAYFTKSDDIENIIKYVRDIEERFFYKLSKHYTALLKNSKCHSAIFDQNVMNMFSDVFANLGIVNYFIIDNYGSYLLIDKNEKYHSLLLMHEETIPEQIEILRNLGYSSKITNAVQSKKMMLYSNSKFQEHLYNCQVIGDYTYTIVSGLSISY
ncbi:hypothetical protein MIDIC_10021 [Alphaproteobacteria bacterium]